MPVVAVAHVKPLPQPQLSCPFSSVVFDAHWKNPEPVPVTLVIVHATPANLTDKFPRLRRSAASVDVFTDQACQAPVGFGADNCATIEDAALSTAAGLRLWVRPSNKEAFELTFGLANAADALPPPGCARLEFSSGTAFLKGPSKFLALVDSFTSVSEITTSVKRVRSLAALADMKTEDLANFAIKRFFIRHGVLLQQVVIKIDREATRLLHPTYPEAQLPLRYADFVVDRSGPKFLGALDADVAVESLLEKDSIISRLLAALKDAAVPKAASFDRNLIVSVKKMAKERYEKLAKHFGQHFASVHDEEIAAATSVFELKHTAQRRLSDFDLTARETMTLASAIAHALGKLAKFKDVVIPGELVREIGNVAWSRGGPIDTDFVLAAVAAAQGRMTPAADNVKKSFEGKYDSAAGIAAYRALIEKDPRFVATTDKSKGFYHVLIQEVGELAIKLLPNSEARVDAGLGLGVPYYGPEVVETDLKLVPTQKKFEIGDVITDETSHYGSIFSHVLNVRRTVSGLGGQVNTSEFERALTFRDNANALIAKNATEEQLADYKRREGFIDTVLMFEQVAKKEAQAQLFKVKALDADEERSKDGKGKLMGNVSDVTQFLEGLAHARALAKSEGRADDLAQFEALGEVVKLSCLIAFPRWGITAKNVKDVGDTAGTKVVTTKEFRASINLRSYSFVWAADKGDEALGHLPTGPRMHVEWSEIDDLIAKQRLDSFRKEMEPVWKFIKENEAHFKAMDALIDAVTKKTDVTEPKKAVRAELDKVLTALANLDSQVVGQGGQLGRATFLDALTDQAEESARFQVGRVAPKKEPAAH